MALSYQKPTEQDPIAILQKTDNEPFRLLQLTDMQIIDLTHTRNATRDRQIKGAYFKEGIPDMDVRCFRYVEELVERVKPDLILLTGDNVYGEFDDAGEMLSLLCRRMEEYGIPWAPVFGNHDNESRIGVRKQIEMLKSCPHCLFAKGNVTGNGNYAVRLKTNGSDVMTLYLLDSNGCHEIGNPYAPEEGITKDNIDYDLIMHKAGIYPDQIAWYQKTAEAIAEENARIVPSLAFFHIPILAYDEAFRTQYGYEFKKDFVATRDGDFGVICEHNAAHIDRDFAFYKMAKAAGTKGFFVGHEHKNDAVIHYDGMCFAYGTKTGTATYYRDDAIGGTQITVRTDGTFTVHHETCEKRLP